MLTLQVQFGADRLHAGQLGVLAPVIVAALVVCLGAVLVPLLGVAISSSRGAVRSWRGGGRRTRVADGAEMHARAEMSELCPHGWRAQITMSATGDDGGRGRMVALDWTELRDDAGHPAVMRRVWASTVGEALEAMVADRRTDETLERIEQGAVAEGARWPDV